MNQTQTSPHRWSPIALDLAMNCNELDEVGEAIDGAVEFLTEHAQRSAEAGDQALADIYREEAKNIAKDRYRIRDEFIVLTRRAKIVDETVAPWADKGRAWHSFRLVMGDAAVRFFNVLFDPKVSKSVLTLWALQTNAGRLLSGRASVKTAITSANAEAPVSGILVNDGVETSFAFSSIAAAHALGMEQLEEKTLSNVLTLAALNALSASTLEEELA